MKHSIKLTKILIGLVMGPSLPKIIFFHLQPMTQVTDCFFLKANFWIGKSSQLQNMFKMGLEYEEV